MTLWVEASSFSQVILGAGSLFLCFWGIMMIAEALFQKRKSLVAMMSVLVLVCYALFYQMKQYFKGLEKTTLSGDSWIEQRSFWGIAVVLFIIFLLIVVVWYSVLQWRKSHITSMSVKEAVDQLPMGVLMYYPNGFIALVNEQMKNLYREMTGRILINGREFLEVIEKREILDGIVLEHLSNKILIHRADGLIFSIREEEMETKSGRTHLLTAADITTEYMEMKELEKEEKELKEANHQLMNYNQEIVAFTIEKEILNAKAKIHDEMGMCILRMKQYMQNGGSKEEEERIRSILHRDIDFLLKEQEMVVDEYTLICDTAKSLGIDIIIDGELPGRQPDKHIIATAIHECFTNTIRHARGEKLFVTLEKQEKKRLIRITNDGYPPTGEFVEKGGLKNLRSMVEQHGGEMKIVTEPEYMVEIILTEERLDVL